MTALLAEAEQAGCSHPGLGALQSKIEALEEEGWAAADRLLTTFLSLGCVAHTDGICAAQRTPPTSRPRSSRCSRTARARWPWSWRRISTTLRRRALTSIRRSTRWRWRDGTPRSATACVSLISTLCFGSVSGYDDPAVAALTREPGRFAQMSWRTTPWRRSSGRLRTPTPRPHS